MTHHYNIEIIATRTHFKVTYRDGKFRKLEHIRGTIDKPFLKALGRIIPLFTKDFGDYNSQFEGKVNYTIITQEKTTYSKFLSEWTLFYENYANMPPKFSGVDGKALKGIIGYLTKVSTSEQEALELWKVILGKWSSLSDFHKANTDLKYINSKLNIILNAIKKSTGNNSEDFAKAMESKAGRGFRFK